MQEVLGDRWEALKTTATHSYRGHDRSDVLTERSAVVNTKIDTILTRFRRQLLDDRNVRKCCNTTRSIDNGPVFLWTRHYWLLGLHWVRRVRSRYWLHGIVASGCSTAHKQSLAWARRARGDCPRFPKPLPSSPTAFNLLPIPPFDALPDPPRKLHLAALQFREERAHEASGEDHALERVDWHELRRLAYFFGHTRVPVLDAHEDAFAVVVS